MRTLAIDCATEACSVALFDDRKVIAADYRVLGRGHAEQLVPMIAAMPGRGQANRILVSLGPGSFTGVRVGISAARALALAWRAEVLGYPTLALVAAMARADASCDAHAWTVCMAGGHGEWFVQDFGLDGMPASELLSLTPQCARTRRSHPQIAGNRAQELATGSPHAVDPLFLLPDARRALLVPQPLLSAEMVPIYGRGPDARLPR